MVMTIKIELKISDIWLWFGLPGTSKVNTSEKFAANSNELSRGIERR
jgi:hypothetical protein